MTIEVNGSPTEVRTDTSIAVLIETLIGTTRGSAVVLDGEVVPRSRWDETTVRDGQVVELITAVQGG